MTKIGSGVKRKAPEEDTQEKKRTTNPKSKTDPENHVITSSTATCVNPSVTWALNHFINSGGSEAPNIEDIPLHKTPSPILTPK